jgi:hypothetical protein
MWLGRKGAPISRLDVAFVTKRQPADQGLEPGLVAAVAELPEYLGVETPQVMPKASSAPVSQPGTTADVAEPAEAEAPETAYEADSGGGQPAGETQGVDPG